MDQYLRTCQLVPRVVQPFNVYYLFHILIVNGKIKPVAVNHIMSSWTAQPVFQHLSLVMDAPSTLNVLSKCQTVIARVDCVSVKTTSCLIVVTGVCLVSIRSFKEFRQILITNYVAAAKIGGYCLNDHQCKMDNKHSKCEWIIPRIYGKCKCPTGFTESSDGRCYPGLGKDCEHDTECEKATNNSYCHRPAFRSATKNAECKCKEGFEEKRFKCEALPKPTLGNEKSN